ncbi:hypothetical protein PSCICJ_36840 [Pseudomonas cichorii]|nr:hypothetical protein PSCICJ_36840 [Pseudomonas cichorii]
MAACILLGASIAGWHIGCPSRVAHCLRREVELSRRDAARVMGMFDQESFGLVRCCLRTLGVRA